MRSGFLPSLWSGRIGRVGGAAIAVAQMQSMSRLNTVISLLLGSQVISLVGVFANKEQRGSCVS